MVRWGDRRSERTATLTGSNRGIDPRLVEESPDNVCEFG
jgi:hypothetical protein